MDSIQFMILTGAFVLGMYAGHDIKLKTPMALAQTMVIGLLVYLSSPIFMRMLNFGSIMFMGIGGVLVLKTVILGTMFMIIVNTLK